MKSENIKKILEACDTTAYEHSYKYKEAALEELEDLEVAARRLRVIEDKLQDGLGETTVIRSDWGIVDGSILWRKVPELWLREVLSWVVRKKGTNAE